MRSAAGGPLDLISFDERGLVPVVAQHAETGEVLMLAYANAEAIHRTIEEGTAWFYSRRRESLWKKGETSGNVLRVRRVQVDCDGDTLLYRAIPTGPVCHTGTPTCFFRDLATPPSTHEAPDEGADASVLGELFGVIEERKRTMPEGSYTSYLFREGIDKIGKKVGEESAEVIIAAKNGITERTVSEVADLWYHTLVLLAAQQISPTLVFRELAKRRK